jgi:uncharacterized membrane protein YhhN
MHFYLIVFALMIAPIDWFAVNRKWKKLEYIAKPMVIVILITWLLINGGYQGPTIFFLIGLGLSLAGDIFLMLPDEKFIAGLVSFLFAHLAYIRGFSISGLHFSIGLLAVIVIVGLIGIVVLRQLLKGLTAHHQEKLRFPIIIYAIVISIMLISALSTVISPSPGWDFYPAIIVSTGAILFFFSDSNLAWNRFVNLVPHGKLMVIISYHLAQIAITLGVGLNYLS